MKGNSSLQNNFAVSAVVGGMILVLIAVIAYIPISHYLGPEAFAPKTDIQTRIEGHVNNTGCIVLKHVGGNALDSYTIELRYINGEVISKQKYNETWRIGTQITPSSTEFLNSEEDKIKILVYSDINGKGEIIFEGILMGKGLPIIPSGLPMLFSSHLTDTTDEDLICHKYGINPQIEAVSYIYNWSLNGNPITRVLLPFDSYNLSVAKDYSGNNNNGTVDVTAWDMNGLVGGAYEFDGIDDYISLPYCFDEDGYIDEITVEAWIKTNSGSVAIASYDRDIFWDLGLSDGVVRWSINSENNITNVLGITNVSDGNWHYIAATYDSSTGSCAIYIDGNQELIENAFDPGEKLGIGINNINGFIGKNISDYSQDVWDILTYDDFESGWGSYSDGGEDCTISSEYQHQGSKSAFIRDDTDQDSSFYHTNGIDVDTNGYTSIKIDFWWMWRDYRTWWGNNGWGSTSGEDWWIRYFDGTNWNYVLDIDYPDDYSEDMWYHETIYINESEGYTFPTDMKIRFQCDASYDNDMLFFDQIYVNATTGGTFTSNYSGLIDEFRIYNCSFSEEQIYQNYLCMKDGSSDISVIVSEETTVNDLWKCTSTPNDRSTDDETVESNELRIKNYYGGEYKNE